MATSQAGKLLRLPQTGPPSSDPSEEARARLNAVEHSVRALEEEMRAMQNMLRQVAIGLDRQLTALSEYRQELAILAPSLAGSRVPAPAQVTAAHAHLAIYCFGRFEVHRSGQPVVMRGTGKGAAILKYLASVPAAPVQRDALLEILWPETDPATANNRLKVAVHHLRQAFGVDRCKQECRGCLVYDSGCYSFNPEITVWTDVHTFEKNYAAGQRLEQAGRLAEALTCYSDAEKLYRGDFLEEDRFEEWTLLRREELREHYLTLLNRLSRCRLQVGEVDLALEGWMKVLAKDPWREDAYRALMHALAARGSRGPALRWYERCVQVLKEQLNIDPEPETVLLYEQIRSGKIPKVAM